MGKNTSCEIVEEGVNKMEDDDLVRKRYPVRAYNE